MRPQRSAPPPRVAAWLAILLSFGAFHAGVLPADASAPAYAVRTTPEATPDANPNDDVDQQPAILAQWSSSGPTRESPGRIVRSLERDHEGHVVERKGTRYPSGAWATRETLVRSNLPGRAPLSDQKQSWDPTGLRTLFFSQTEVLDAAGAQVAGKRRTSRYSDGRSVLEIEERWDPSFGGWLQTRVLTTAYYADGSLKRRVTERPALDRKTEEDWGPAGPRGLRKKTDFLWNGTVRRMVPEGEGAP